METNWMFWRSCAHRARVGAAGFANDWQWFTGVPAASAIGVYIAAKKGSDLTTGYPIIDGVIAAAVAFLITWLVAFVINVWREAPKIYLEEKKRADTAEERLRPKLRLAYAGHKMSWQDRYKHTFVQAVNDSETVISRASPKIVDSQFKKSGSNKWISTAILANLNMSWCDVPDDFPDKKYFPGDVPQGAELIDFVKVSGHPW